jgi:hypothetical protein
MKVFRESTVFSELVTLNGSRRRGGDVQDSLELNLKRSPETTGLNLKDMS